AVDDRALADAGLAHELAEARLLIARERLRRIEVERARVGILRERLHHREVEAEALAARRRRRDDDAAMRERAGRGLARPGRVDGRPRDRAPRSAVRRVARHPR